MPTFTVRVPDDDPEWFTEFNKQLMNCFDGVSKQMDELDTNFRRKLDAQMNKLDTSLGGKLDALKTAVKSELTEVRKIATEARDLAQSNAKAVQSLEQRMFNLERKCNALNVKNKRLTEQQEQQDTYSRKENLVVRGIDEAAEEETKDMCMAAVRNVFINNLNLHKDYVNGITIVRCHRLGRKDNSGNYKRPIIVRFLNFNDRKTVWSKRMTLKNSPIFILDLKRDYLQRNAPFACWKLLIIIMLISLVCAHYN